MKQFITIPSLRVKITGICNRSCNFCNEEGDMRTIKSVEPNKKFFECINTLAKILAIKRVMITGYVFINTLQTFLCLGNCFSKATS
jgi:molybdenum cofactor biosynthesis enzyme MoaA